MRREKLIAVVLSFFVLLSVIYVHFDVTDWLFLVTSPIPRPAKDNEFQAIDGRPDIFAYSAFADLRINVKYQDVRVTLLLDSRSAIDKLFLHFFDTGNQYSYVVPSRNVEAINIYRNDPIGSWLANFPLSPKLTAQSSVYISFLDYSVLESELFDWNAAHLVINKVKPAPQSGKAWRYNNSLCVRALHNTRKMNAQSLAEFLLASQQMGVDFITIYVFDNPLDTSIANLLDKFSQGAPHCASIRANGRRKQSCLHLRILPYRLPRAQESYSLAQPIGEFDCLYRSMSDSELIFFNDIDEIIVPTDTSVTTGQMARSILHNHNYPAICFRVRWFLPPDILKSRNIEVTETGFQMIGLIWASEYLYGIPRKCIVNATRIFVEAVHQPLIDANMVRLPRYGLWTRNDIALVHHYRKGRWSQQRKPKHPPKEYIFYKDQTVVGDTSLLEYLGLDGMNEIHRGLTKFFD